LDQPDPVAHLCDYRCLAEGLFLLPRTGDPKLIVSASADGPRLAARQDGIQWVATDDLISAVAGSLSKGNAQARSMVTVGIDSLPYQLRDHLLSLVPNATPFEETLYGLTPRKTMAERNRAVRAAAIAQKGFERLLELAHVGQSESALAVELNCYTKSLGANDNFLMLSASPHNSAVAPSSNRKLEPGDILLVEFSPGVEGQFSQICRTIVIGFPSAELQEKYSLVVQAMWAGIETIRPGIPLSRVCQAIDSVLEKAGYEKFCVPPYIRRRGHGLGCGSVAPGDVARGNHMVLEEDMLFVVHPNQYIPEVGYLLCGESIRVTGDGCETLSPQTAALAAVVDQTGASSCG
jgi:Xaa-Pro aminopeptidase